MASNSTEPSAASAKKFPSLHVDIPIGNKRKEEALDSAYQEYLKQNANKRESLEAPAFHFPSFAASYSRLLQDPSSDQNSLLEKATALVKSTCQANQQRRSERLDASSALLKRCRRDSLKISLPKAADPTPKAVSLLIQECNSSLGRMKCRSSACSLATFSTTMSCIRYSHWVATDQNVPEEPYGAPLFDFFPYLGDDFTPSKDLQVVFADALLEVPLLLDELLVCCIAADIASTVEKKSRDALLVFLEEPQSHPEASSSEAWIGQGQLILSILAAFSPSLAKRVRHVMGSVTESPGSNSGIWRKYDECVRMYFCRRCFQFGCNFHNDIVFPQRRTYSATPKERQPSPCARDCGCLEEDTVDDGSLSQHSELLAQAIEDGFTLCQIAQLFNVACRAVYSWYARNRPLATPVRTPLPLTAGATSYNKKLKVRYSVDIQTEERCTYIPCFHPGVPCKFECPCAGSDLYCEKYCLCPLNCPNRFPGCNCRGKCSNTGCICYQALRECDPDLCKPCHAGQAHEDHQASTPLCRNNSLQLKRWKKLFVTRSRVQGLGVIAGEPINDGELISEYVGERISEAEAERRGRIYDAFGCSYLFNLDREHAIDAFRIGSSIRFANHTERNPNAIAKIICVSGEWRIGIYAKGNIKRGTEILFNYGYKEDYKRFVSNSVQ